EYVFGGAKEVGGRLGAYPQWPVPFELAVDPAVEARFVRRVDQGNAALCIELCQRGPQQVDLTDAGLGGHEFHQGAQGPALSWQFLVQGGKPRADRGLAGARKLGSPPQCRVDTLGMQQGGGSYRVGHGGSQPEWGSFINTVCMYSINIQYKYP